VVEEWKETEMGREDVGYEKGCVVIMHPGDAQIGGRGGTDETRDDSIWENARFQVDLRKQRWLLAQPWLPRLLGAWPDLRPQTGDDGDDEPQSSSSSFASSFALALEEELPSGFISLEELILAGKIAASNSVHLLDGVTMARKRLRFVPTLILRYWLAEVIEALSTLHEHGVASWSIRPASIAIGPARVVITNLWGSRSVKKSSRQNTNTGGSGDDDGATDARAGAPGVTSSPLTYGPALQPQGRIQRIYDGYVPPEQIEMSAKDQNLEVACATDIWQFGCLVAELLSGRMPNSKPLPRAMGGTGTVAKVNEFWAPRPSSLSTSPSIAAAAADVSTDMLADALDAGTFGGLLSSSSSSSSGSGGINVAAGRQATEVGRDNLADLAALCLQLDPTARPRASQLIEIPTLALTAMERAQATSASQIFMKYQRARLIVEEELACSLRTLVLQEDIRRTIVLDVEMPDEVVYRRGFVNPADLSAFFAKCSMLMFGEREPPLHAVNHGKNARTLGAHARRKSQSAVSSSSSSSSSSSPASIDRAQVVSEIFRRRILETATELCLRQYTALLSLAAVSAGEMSSSHSEHDSHTRAVVDETLYPHASDGGAPMAIECIVKLLRASFVQFTREERVFSPHAAAMLATLLKLYSGDERFGTRCRSSGGGGYGSDALEGRRVAGQHWTPQVQRLVQPLLHEVLSESGAGNPAYPALVSCIAALPAVPPTSMTNAATAENVVVPIGRRCLAEVEGIGLALSRLCSSAPPSAEDDDEGGRGMSRRSKAVGGTSSHSCRTAIVHLAPLLRGRGRASASVASATDTASMLQLCVEYDAINKLIAPVFHQDAAVRSELLDLFEQTSGGFVTARGGAVGKSLDPAIADLARVASDALLRDLTAFELTAPLVQILLNDVDKKASAKIFAEHQRAVLRIFRNTATLSGDAVRCWPAAGVLSAIIRMAHIAIPDEGGKRSGGGGGRKGSKRHGGGPGSSSALLEGEVRDCLESLLASGNRTLLQRLEVTPRATLALRKFQLQLPLFSTDGVEALMKSIERAASPEGGASEALALMPSVRAALSDAHSWMAPKSLGEIQSSKTPAAHRVIGAMQILVRRFWHAERADESPPPYANLTGGWHPGPQSTDVVNEVLAIIRQMVLSSRNRAAQRAGGISNLLVKSGLMNGLIELAGNPPLLAESHRSALTLQSTLGAHLGNFDLILRMTEFLLTDFMFFFFISFFSSAVLETLASCLEVGGAAFTHFLSDLDIVHAFARIMQSSCAINRDFKELQDAVPAQGPTATLVSEEFRFVSSRPPPLTFTAFPLLFYVHVGPAAVHRGVTRRSASDLASDAAHVACREPRQCPLPRRALRPDASRRYNLLRPEAGSCVGRHRGANAQRAEQERGGVANRGDYHRQIGDDVRGEPRRATRLDADDPPLRHRCARSAAACDTARQRSGGEASSAVSCAATRPSSHDSGKAAAHARDAAER
jgi:serine/threonine protein kinase